LLNQQADIIRTLGVAPTFDVAAETERRIAFLADYLRASAMRAYVLGISGGIDSLTAALVAQAAVQRLREHGHQAEFVAARLPYGVQADEADAQKALAAIGPDRTITIDIKPAADAMLEEVHREAGDLFEAARVDFHLGNIKARQRMIAQYALAGAVGGLVIGTDHAAEALMGFFTKFGDGACDLAPLSGLVKNQVRAIARSFGAPESLVEKVPTADLEDLEPGKPDEASHGVTYQQIDAFLHGQPVDQAAFDIIVATYRKTQHKRELPFAP